MPVLPDRPHHIVQRGHNRGVVGSGVAAEVASRIGRRIEFRGRGRPGKTMKTAEK